MRELERWGIMSVGRGYNREHAWMEQSECYRGEVESMMTELGMDVLREVAGTNPGWTVFAPRESVKVWLWYGMASRQNLQGGERIEEHEWRVNGSSTDKAEFEPWMDL